jgi:hypothetical protein
MSFANYVPHKYLELPKEVTNRIHQKINAMMNEFFQKLQTISQYFTYDSHQEMIFYDGRSVISWTGAWVIIGTCPYYSEEGKLLGFLPYLDLIEVLMKDKTIQSTEVTIIDQDSGLNDNWENELRLLLEKSIPCFTFAVKHERELMNERKVKAIKEAAEKYEL